MVLGCSTFSASFGAASGMLTCWATQVNVSFHSDKARLRRFRLPLIVTAVVTAIAFTFAHFEITGARTVFAFVNVSVFTIGAALAALSLVCIFRHRRWSFTIDLSLGTAAAVFMLLWLIPIYVYGLLSP